MEKTFALPPHTELRVLADFLFVDLTAPSSYIRMHLGTQSNPPAVMYHYAYAGDAKEQLCGGPTFDARRIERVWSAKHTAAVERIGFVYGGGASQWGVDNVSLWVR